MPRAPSSPAIVLIVVCASTVVAPSRALTAQAFDSTGMPSLELLALEAGRASRHHPIRVVAHAILCEPTHPLVDSASVAACVALDSTRAAAITAAFARGVELPLTTAADSVLEPPICPADLDRGVGPRILLARITAPVVGVREGKWEGRLSVELRCRSPAASGERIRTMGKGYLYQWSGRAWQLYQFSWWRAER
jgi:hypothetical protein